jgi:predicted Fe-Mo cluster-binding NifX family protein
MGMSAQNLFSNHGVKVVIGALESDPEVAVLKHLNGSLDMGGNVCDH